MKKSILFNEEKGLESKAICEFCNNEVDLLELENVFVSKDKSKKNV